MRHIIRLAAALILSLSGTCPGLRAQEPESFDPDTESGFYYTIQKGDTLWGLSQKFYASQWDWPGLWELNKDIKNPHWIYPGNKIRIYMKPQPVKPSPVPEPAAPAPEPAAPPVLPQFSYSEIDHVGFIRKTAQEPLGHIIRERDGNLLMSVNDIIYLKPDVENAFEPGEMYQVFSIEDVREKIKKNKTFQGVKHIIKADIRVLDTNGSYATAVITDSFLDANVGDAVMPYYKREGELTVQAHPDPIDAVILVSQENTVMVNDRRIAFINRGSDHHIRPGQVYSVMKENRSAFDGTQSLRHAGGSAGIRLAPLNSGKLIVLHVEDIASTVLILSSKRDIHPGDMVN